MRLLWRTILGILIVVWLVTVALMAASYWVPVPLKRDEIQCNGVILVGTGFSWTIDKGCLEVTWQTQLEYDRLMPSGVLNVRITNHFLFRRRSWPSQFFAHGPGWTIVDSAESVIVPLWPLLVLLSICPALTVIRVIRGRLPKPGHCRCGYNLTGNTSGVCPECGRALTS